MKNTLLALASIICTLLVLEFGLRIAQPFFSKQPDPLQAERHLYSPYRGHKLNPLFNTRNNTEGRVIHSPDGFRRDAPVARQKPPKTIRIFAMGASTLYGLGTWGSVYPNRRDLFNDELATFHLEQALNGQLASEGSAWRVEVVNTAVVAYQTFQQLVYLNETLLAYAPDIIISVEGHNDFYIADPGFDPWGMYSYSSVPFLEAVNKRDFLTALHVLSKSLASGSALVSQLEKRVLRPLLEQHIETQPAPMEDVQTAYSEQHYLQTARKTFVRAYWQMSRLGELEGFRHLVYLQPEIALEEPEQLSPHDRSILEITLKHLRRPPELMQRIHERLPSLFQAYGIAFHDASKLARPNDVGDLYVDYCHLTPQGSKRLAENILPSLRKEVWTRIAERERQDQLQE